MCKDSKRKPILIASISFSLLLILCLGFNDLIFWKIVSYQDTKDAYQAYLTFYDSPEYGELAKIRIDELSFSAAEDQNTITSYRQYLEEFPNGKFAEKAESLIDKLSFNMAKKRDTIKAYEHYLAKFPKGRFTESAKVRIDQLSFKAAQLHDTIEAYQEYLNNFPKGKFADNARLRTDELAYHQAKTTNTIDAYQKFQSSCKTLKYWYKANGKLDYLYFTKAETSEKLTDFENYMQKFPKGKHSKLAQKWIYYLNCKKAIQTNTLEALEDYLRTFPQNTYTIHVEKAIVRKKWRPLKKSEMEAALKYYRVIESPASTADFKTKLVFLKRFQQEHPDTNIMSQGLKDFVADNVKFTTSEIPLMFNTYHNRRRCGNWLCTEYYYPRVRDYYAAKVYKDELVIYHDNYIRTVYSIEGNKDLISFINGIHSEYVQFPYSHNLCSKSCDSSYQQSSGEPLSFYESFGKINSAVFSKNFDDCLTDDVPERLANKYSKCQLVKSVDKTKSYFILNEIIDAASEFVEENPLLAAVTAVAIYSALSTDSSSSSSSTTSSSSSSSSSSSYSSSSREVGTLAIKVENEKFWGIVRGLNISIKGQNSYHSDNKDVYCSNSICDSLHFNAPYDTYDLTIACIETSGSKAYSRAIEIKNVPHRCQASEVFVNGDHARVSCY